MPKSKGWNPGGDIVDKQKKKGYFPICPKDHNRYVHVHEVINMIQKGGYSTADERP